MAIDGITKAIEELDKQLAQAKALRLYLMEQYQLALELEEARKIEQQELALELDAKREEKQTELPLK